MTITAKTMLDSNLEGQLLIAMPGMADTRFSRSVVYMCAHSDEGAMGLIINQATENLNLGTLLEQIDMFREDEAPAELDAEGLARRVQNGGPVETSRGFVLHSPDYFAESATVKITDGICLTTTTDILKAIASGQGPKKLLLALGYAGWGPGQLENELGANGWLNCAADPDVVFADDLEAKYDLALSKLGVDPSHLVSGAGRA
jgi:putative transcriptional regulator